MQGEEIGPLEMQANSLNKQIESASQGITDLQQFWLRQQHELVHLCKQRDQQNGDLENLKKQRTILTQKRLRIEGGFVLYVARSLAKSLRLQMGFCCVVQRRRFELPLPPHFFKVRCVKCV